MADMFTCTIDTSNLMKAQRIFDRHSKTIPAQALNRTAYFIVKAAMDATVPTSVGRIDTELSVVTSPAILESGRRSKDKRRQREVINLPEGGRGYAAMIAVSRMWPQSKYSKLTGNRWPIPVPKTSGRRAFWDAINVVAERMVKSRHSSVAFFKSSWKAILQQLAPHLPPKYRRTSKWEGPPVENALGFVQPAEPGLTALCTVENRMGMGMTNTVLDTSRNLRAHRFLGPILQQAIDNEFQSKMEEAVAKGWVDDKAELAALGFIVTT